MDKLKLAHDWYLKQLEVHENASIHGAWQYADAMQAEAEERVNKERPEVLCEVDWRVAPLSAHAWQMVEGHAVWINSHGPMGNAPSFGFTGSHIVERPQ